MKIGPIAILLRLAGTHFGNNIGGVVELNLALQYTLTTDMAFVIPLSEDAGDDDGDTSTNQRLVEKFAVLIALKADASSRDKTGIGAYDQIHEIRAELIRELVGLDLGYESTVRYTGARLIDFSPAYLWYQFEFEFDSRVQTDEDGFGEIGSRTVTGRRPWSELEDFNDIMTQYILTPSLKWNEVEKILIGEGNHLPLSATLIDAEQFVDLSQPYTGGFDGSAFVRGIDRYRINK